MTNPWYKRPAVSLAIRREAYVIIDRKVERGVVYWRARSAVLTYTGHWHQIDYTAHTTLENAKRRARRDLAALTWPPRPPYIIWIYPKQSGEKA